MITENLITRLNVQAVQRLVANVRIGRRHALSSISKCCIVTTDEGHNTREVIFDQPRDQFAATDGGVQGLLGLSDGTLGVTTDIDSNALGRTDLTQGFINMCLGENTTLANRFLTGEEMSAMGSEMRHLAPDGDLGAFNRMDAVASAQVMEGLFGEGNNEIVRNMARARAFINTGGAETPSYQNLYAQMYPEDVTNGYPTHRVFAS